MSAAASVRRTLSTAAASAAELDAKYVLGTYGRFPVTLARGQGTQVWDESGKEYLDFCSGIAVNCLGHSDPGWVEAVTRQAATLTHTSNLYCTEPQARLAQRLVELSPGLGKAFFCNSGTEALEAALKFTRRFFYGAERPRGRVVAFHGAFHGRSMGSLSITPKDAIRKPFAPLLDGVDFAPFNDAAAVADYVDETVSAVVVEPVQGEGGIVEGSPEFLRAVREAADRAGALVVADEVQSFARTDRLWASEELRPDVVTLAKPLAAGLPIGCTLVTDRVAAAVQPGDHGTTFGGNPLACAAALHVVDRLVALQPEVAGKGRLLRGLLRDELVARHPSVAASVRGSGLLVGLRLADGTEPAAFAREALNHGLLLAPAGDNTVRFLPPLTASADEIREGVARAVATAEAVAAARQ